ncbi:MAG: glycerol kinase GlpK [Chloroflexota bacterium]|nr:glycerol kinase GlpK [Chloroflexota bacterium]
MGNTKYILALDQGTTSSRAVIFDISGKIISVSQQEFGQLFPKPGWVEHDPMEIWNTQLKVAKDVLSNCGISATDILAIGIANQRETVVVWDRFTGKPVYNAIVWQDRRTSPFCEYITGSGLSDLITSKTGLVVDPYFSATKVRWILDEVKGVRSRAIAGDLLFGTVDSWLIWNLTSQKVHSTDYTNASRTMMANIHTVEWDQELLDLYDIPFSMLPEIKSSSGFVGIADRKWLGTEIPICGVSGDQQAALFGQKCFTEGSVKNTYGTGCFVVMFTGNNLITSQTKMLTSLACHIDGDPTYILEGSVFNGGSTVQWLRDQLGIIDSSSQIEELALQVSDSDGVYFVPAFTGLGAPLWDPYARGLIVGMTRATNKSHLARAVLDSIAHQSADVIEAMQVDSNMNIRELRVDGGASRNDTLMQIQADLLERDVVRPEIIESTALGVAYLAGLEVGFWKTLEALPRNMDDQTVFKPSESNLLSRGRRSEWSKAVKRSLSWVDDGRDTFSNP